MLTFSKMHGLGNDFMVINGITQSIHLPQTLIQTWAHRLTGIGFDQLLLIQSSNIADFACVIYNADGSEAEQCGNGMRCVARFIHENKLLTRDIFSIATKGGIVHATIINYDDIRISMGLPIFEPSAIPFQADRIRNLYEIPLEEDQPGLAIAVLSMGNPHAILQVSAIHHFPVAKLGPLISKHPLFPHETNVGFMEVLSPTHIRLRTYERGVGETLACGSNACAAVVAGINSNILDREVCVELPLGNLHVKWPDPNHPVELTGPATLVFSGLLNL